MKDKFSSTDRQHPSKPRQGASSAGVSERHNLLHDHRSSDSLFEYLDDLEE